MIGTWAVLSGKIVFYANHNMSLKDCNKIHFVAL